MLAAGRGHALNEEHAGAADTELSAALRALATAAERLSRPGEALTTAAEAVAAATAPG